MKERDKMSKITVFRNVSVLTEDAEHLMNQDVWVRDGKIAVIGSAGDYKPASPEEEAAETIEGKGMFLSPGIPNLHVHAAMNIFKGIAEDVTADTWFNEMIWPYESKMTKEDAYVGTLLGICEMINNGVTAMADHYFYEDEVMKAVLETGIRGDLAPTVFGMTPDYKERLAKVTEFIKQHKGKSDLVTFHMGPHAGYTCPDPTLGEIIDTAKSLELPIHLHVSEEEAQVIKAKELSGRTPFQVLHDAGGFDCKVLIGHGLWIEEDDLKYLKEDTWFAFCPKTYMKLASGQGGFFKYNSKFHYGFGTDGAASSNTLNPVEQARLLALLGKYQDMDASAYDAAAIWKHLMGGHDALGFGAGKMKVGAPADLVLWNLHTPDTFPYYNPITAILYSSNSSNVRYTMVGGEFLKYDGQLRMNTEELYGHAAELQRALLARGKGKAEMFY